jgi:hypothetical protein
VDAKTIVQELRMGSLVEEETGTTQTLVLKPVEMDISLMQKIVKMEEQFLLMVVMQVVSLKLDGLTLKLLLEVSM